jgi:hypothetical protein
MRSWVALPLSGAAAHPLKTLLQREMNTTQKRTLLFLVGCIGTRSLLAYAAKVASPDYLTLMGWLALVPAFGFLYFYLSGSRTTGPEVFGGKIWWNDLRPIHAAFYIGFAVTAIQRLPYSWMFLLADVVFGLLSFLAKRVAPVVAAE